MSLFQPVPPVSLSNVIELNKLSQRAHVGIEDIAQTLVYLVDKTEADLSVRGRAQFFLVGDKRVDVSVMPGYVQFQIWPASRSLPALNSSTMTPIQNKPATVRYPRVTPSPDHSASTSSFQSHQNDQTSTPATTNTTCAAASENPFAILDTLVSTEEEEELYDDDDKQTLEPKSNTVHDNDTDSEEHDSSSENEEEDTDEDEDEDEDDGHDWRKWSRKCIVRHYDITDELRRMFDSVEDKFGGKEAFHWYVFSDAVQDPIWRFVGDFQNVEDVIHTMVKHTWCHAYDPNYRLFVDLNQQLFQQGLPGVRVMRATSKQHAHFEQEQKQQQQLQTSSSDQKEAYETWYIFENHCDFNSWNFIGIAPSMLEARERIKSLHLEWAHMYCPNKQQLFNIEIGEKCKFWQRERSISPVYTERFNQWLATHDSDSNERIKT